MSHLVSNNGFVLPTYVSTQNTGCPVDTWQISTVNNAVTAPAGLNNPAIVGSDRLVQASD